MAAQKLEVLAASRPFQGEEVSGDAWLHLTYEWGDRVILVDGAGHGPAAAAAANIALDTWREFGAHAIDDAFRRSHQALHSSRGAVLSIVDITPSSITFAGVGNVDGRLIHEGRVTRFTPDRGLLGATLPRIRPMTLELPRDDWFIVLHSDGVSSRLDLQWQSLREAQDRSALLNQALEQWGRATDDATLVLIAPVGMLLPMPD